jgi:hypothetical protein
VWFRVWNLGGKRFEAHCFSKSMKSGRKALAGSKALGFETVAPLRYYDSNRLIL